MRLGEVVDSKKKKHESWVLITFNGINSSCYKEWIGGQESILSLRNCCKESIHDSWESELNQTYCWSIQGGCHYRTFFQRHKEENCIAVDSNASQVKGRWNHEFGRERFQRRRHVARNKGNFQTGLINERQRAERSLRAQKRQTRHLRNVTQAHVSRQLDEKGEQLNLCKSRLLLLWIEGAIIRQFSFVILNITPGSYAKCAEPAWHIMTLEGLMLKLRRNNIPWALAELQNQNHIQGWAKEMALSSENWA